MDDGMLHISEAFYEVPEAIGPRKLGQSYLQTGIVSKATYVAAGKLISTAHCKLGQPYLQTGNVPRATHVAAGKYFPTAHCPGETKIMLSTFQLHQCPGINVAILL